MIKARTLRIEAHLPSNLWPEIIKAAGYLMNRTPVYHNNWKTPFELVTGHKPSLSHLRVYGCKAYPLKYDIPKLDRLEPRAHIGILVGYDSTNIFRVWIPSLRSIIRTRDVLFNEQELFHPSDVDAGHLVGELEQLTQVLQFESIGEEIEVVTEDILDETDPQVEPVEPVKPAKTTVQPSTQLLTPSPTPSALGSPPPVVSSSTPGSRGLEISADFSESNILPTRTRQRHEAHAIALKHTSNLSAYHGALTTARAIPKIEICHRNTLPPEPRNWKEMTRHPHAEGFQQAAEKEYQDLRSKNTFEYVPENKYNKRLLPLTWVFKYKLDSDGFLVKYKARLCARGDLHHTEQDTYAATLAAQTLRSVMALVAAFDLETQQYDVVNAFVNSELETPIACHYPEGFLPNDCTQTLLIRRALYGLPESPLLWSRNFSDTLQSFGLNQVPGVNCLFTNGNLLVLYYVDDIIVTAFKFESIMRFQAKLMASYEVRCLGSVSMFLGIRVVRNRQERKLALVQDEYIDKIATRFHIELSTRVINTPLPCTTLVRSTEQATPQQIFAYQQRVGSINFAAVFTRPDISFATSKLSEFMQNPSKAHLDAADHTIRYLLQSKYSGIVYDGNAGSKNGKVFTTWSDAAFADDPDTFRSSTGYLFLLWGGPIHWKATKLTTVTTSSTEAELMAISITGKELMWWKRYFESINFDTEEFPSIYCDNLQTIRLLTKDTPRLNTKLKHVNIHKAWLRQEVQKSTLAINWVASADMIADGLTKALPPQRHRIFVEQLGLTDTRTINRD